VEPSYAPLLRRVLRCEPPTGLSRRSSRCDSQDRSRVVAIRLLSQEDCM
jgi:hypothetical protein